MKFTKQNRKQEEPNVLQSWYSETGRWKVEIVRVMFGTRVQARIGQGISIDYCMGNNQPWIEAGAVAIMRILEQYDESATAGDVEEPMPRYNCRPMFRDPRCWRQLCEMALVDTDHKETALLIDEYDLAPNRDYFTCAKVDQVRNALFRETS